MATVELVLGEPLATMQETFGATVDVTGSVCKTGVVSSGLLESSVSRPTIQIW